MATKNDKNIPIYNLRPDKQANIPHLRIYNFEGSHPDAVDLLTPHRKDHYLIVFIRQADTRQWIDMKPYVIKGKKIYFTGPNQIIVKEGIDKIWSTGIAFTEEFLSLQENIHLSHLQLIKNTCGIHELDLSSVQVEYIEDLLSKINQEYQSPGQFQYQMLTSYISTLITYLSRLYVEQTMSYLETTETQLISKFQRKINNHFQQHHEVTDYASMLSISAKHLSEVVKSQSGKPAIKHIHERIVLESRRLLFHTQHSSKEIAYSLGFIDPSYFNRFFKRETGVTPAEYRQAIRKIYH